MKAVLFILFSILISCSNSVDTSLSSIKTGEAIIYTKSDSSYFSFDAGRPVSRINDSNFIPDFMSMVATNAKGEPISIEIFSAFTENNSENVMIIGNEITFDTLQTLDNDFWLMSMSAKKNLTYAIRTHDFKYALVLVEEADFYLDSSSSESRKYIGHIKFKWKYQTDGSRNFR